jgi:hypothetical protein
MGGSSAPFPLFSSALRGLGQRKNGPTLQSETFSQCDVMCITLTPLFWIETTIFDRWRGDIEPKVGIEIALESQ